MAENSKIEWTDHTFNSWTGCTKVSPACDNCYAEAWSKRSGIVKWGNYPRRRTSKSYWRQPLKWNREAERDGVRRKVFCCSLADVFDNQVPIEWVVDLFDLIFATRALDWLLLTKRPQNIFKRLKEAAENGKGVISGAIWQWLDYGRPPSNVWLGTTVENQEEADRRIPQLLAIPAAVHFLSCEPLLGPLDLSNFTDPDDQACFADDLPAMKKWVITGGESGPHARDTDPSWFRDIGLQCAAAGVPWFHKQMTRKARIPHNLFVREFPCPDGAVV